MGPRSPRLVGIALIVCVSVIWVTSSFVVKDLESNGAVSPYIVSLMANGLFVVFLPIAYLRRWRTPDPPKASQTTLSDWDVFQRAATVAPFFWLGQCTFNMSLQWTSVSSNTILSSTGSLFTFLLSLAFLDESFHCYKLFSLALCCAGTVMVGLSDMQGEAHSVHAFLGDGLAVLSAFLYACYATMMSKWLPATSNPDMLLFFGYMGSVQLVLFSSLGLVLVYWGLIPYQLTLYDVMLILIKGIFDNVLSDVLWIKALCLIGPTISTVGLSLQWPMALLIDAFFFQPSWMANPFALGLAIAGSAWILIGFVGINIPTEALEKLYTHIHTVDDRAEDLKTTKSASAITPLDFAV